MAHLQSECHTQGSRACTAQHQADHFLQYNHDRHTACKSSQHAHVPPALLPFRWRLSGCAQEGRMYCDLHRIHVSAALVYISNSPTRLLCAHVLPIFLGRSKVKGTCLCHWSIAVIIQQLCCSPVGLMSAPINYTRCCAGLLHGRCKPDGPRPQSRRHHAPLRG